MTARGWWSRGAVLLISALLMSCAGSPDKQDPASTSRTLAQQDVDGLLLGMGMGMAAPAEINGYPGPRHVLELKDELDLTPDQRFATSRLIGQMLGQARALGQRIVDAERRLDADMASGELSGPQIKARVEGIASLRAQLRFTHIDAHLKQKKILRPEQVARYYELRGRDVTVPPPGALPEPTEPLAIQPPTPDDGAPADDTSLVPVPMPAPAPAVDVLPTPAFEEETFTPVPEFKAEPEPLAPTAPAEAPQGLTPGMQDALEEAEPAPVTIEALPQEAEPVSKAVTVDEAPALPPPSTQEVTAPAVIAPVVEEPVVEEPRVEDVADEEPVETTPARLSPGMQDAMEEAEPVTVDEAPALPPTPREAVAPVPEIESAQVTDAVIEGPVETAPATLSPGMQDAMEESEAVIVDETPAAPVREVVAPAGIETAPDDVVVDRPVETTPVVAPEPVIEEPAARTAPATLSPGMQDAMELAEPVPASSEAIAGETGEIYIAPLEEEEEIEVLPPIEPREPVMIDLDN